MLSDHSFKRHNLRIFEWFIIVKIYLKGRKRKFRGLYPVHIRALLSLYQINTDKCTISYCYAPHNDDSVNDGPHIQEKKSYMHIFLTDLFSERNAFRSILYHVHIPELVSLYQVNTDTCTRTLLNHYFNNTIRNCNMFQPLKSHLQGLQLIHSSSIYVTQYTLHTKLNFTTGDSFYWPTLPECIDYTP